MTDIIVAFPVLDDANRIRRLLIRNGYDNVSACTSGAQVINIADEHECGIVICGYKLTDMIYSDLYELLPADFSVLLLASSEKLNYHYENFHNKSSENKNVIDCHEKPIYLLEMPLKLPLLINAVNDLLNTQRVNRRKRRQQGDRSEKEKAVITEAKMLLMSERSMTEEQAHRYIQKISMDSGNPMIETAEMIKRLFM